MKAESQQEKSFTPGKLILTLESPDEINIIYALFNTPRHTE